jgi:hypothetical protein
MSAAMLARIRQHDGTFGPGVLAEVEGEPNEGEYIRLSDGREVQVMGFARHPDGEIHFAVVVEVDGDSIA